MGGNDSRFVAWIVGNAIVLPAAVPLALIITASLIFGGHIALPFSIGVMAGAGALLGFLYLRFR